MVRIIWFMVVEGHHMLARDGRIRPDICIMAGLKYYWCAPELQWLSAKGQG